jgi:NAD(P)-dependent dehydrogenase (short-subunit alcohol dehydrogenase family)
MTLQTKKTILITGCSSGFGKITFLHLAKLGHTVFGTVRKEVDREALLNEAKQHGGAGTVEIFLCDVVHQDQVQELGRKIAAKTPHLDALLNNAGSAFAAPMELIPPDVLRDQLDLNVIAQVAVTQAMMPLLRAAKGTIINVTSVGGKLTGAMLGAYNASKFAMEAISDVFRVELAPFGVNVAIIEPGASPTDIWQTSANRALQMLKDRGIDASAYDKLVQASIKTAEKNSKEGFPPELFAQTVEKILNSDRPKTRYPIPASIGWAIRLRPFLTDRMWDSILRRSLKW